MKTLDERWRQANASGDTASAELLAELMDAQTLINSDELDQTTAELKSIRDQLYELNQATDELKSIRDQLYELIRSINKTLKEVE